MHTKNHFILFTLFYVLILVVQYYLMDVMTDIIYGFNFLCLSGILMLFAKTEKQTNRDLFNHWVRPSNILTISLLIVNLQIIACVWLGYDTISNYLETTEYSNYIGKVFYAGLMGICCYLIGYSWSKKHPRSRLNRRSRCFFMGYSWSKNMGNARSTRVTDVTNPKILLSCLVLVCFLLFIVNIDIASFLTGMDYEGSGAADRTTSASAIWETLLDTFLTIEVAYITKGAINSENKITFVRYLKMFPVLIWVVVGLYMTLRLVSGDRGPVIYTGLMFFYSYIMVSKIRIKPSTLILFILLGAFSMTVINSVRSYRNFDQSFSEKVLRSFDDFKENDGPNTFSPFTHELAKSVNCNFIAIHDVNEWKTDLKYGLYNFCELAGCIPGSASFFKALFDLDIYRTVTSEYVTISFFGKNYLIGLGTTAIVDFYLDFGLLGIILGMFLLGLTYKKIDSMLIENVSSIFLLIFFLKFASMAIYIPRASFSFVLNRCLYICVFYVFIYVLASITSSFRKKRFIRQMRRYDVEKMNKK